MYIQTNNKYDINIFFLYNNNYNIYVYMYYNIFITFFNILSFLASIVNLCIAFP